MRNAEKKNFAQGLFVKSDLNRKEIATQVGVTEKTLRKWIDDGGWQELKDVQSITRSQLLIDAYKQLAAINKKINDEHEGVPTKELSDAKGVIRKEIETLSDNPLYLYVEVFENFTDWMARNHPKHLKDLARLSYDFVQEVAKKK